MWSKHVFEGIYRLIRLTNTGKQTSHLTPSFCVIWMEFNRTTVSGQRLICVVEKCQCPKVAGGLSRLPIRRLPFRSFACQNCLEDRLGSLGVFLAQLGERLFNTRGGIWLIT